MSETIPLKELPVRIVGIVEEEDGTYALCLAYEVRGTRKKVTIYMEDLDCLNVGAEVNLALELRLERQR
jgi:hypothetical protein